MKIGFFTPYFFPAWRFGGPVRNTYELGKRLVERGHQVKIYTTDLSNYPNQRIKVRKILKEGMDIYYFKNLSNRLASYYNVFLPFEMRNYLMSEIKDLDIIHLQDIYTIITFWLYRRIKKLNKPLFVTTRGVLSYQSQKKHKLVKKILNRFMFKFLKSANKIFVQTKNEKKDCQNFGLFNTVVLNNGIDVSEFYNLPEKSVFRKKFNLSMKDIIILYLGRINKVKGLNFLVEAFSELTKNRKVKLVLIGPDDNYLKSLQKIIRKYELTPNILIINGLYGREKLEAYSSADIFCLPSIYDCSPNSMLEACASGLPIITTYANGLFDIVKNGAGIVINSQNTIELIKALITLNNNPRLRKKCGNYGREIVLCEHNWNKIIDLLESIYYKSLK